MLRKIRIALAAVCWTALVLLFLDFTGTIATHFGWLAKIQIFPAHLAYARLIVGSTFLVTLLFGRLYCSILCPLGVCTDIASGIVCAKKKNRFSYKKPNNIVRAIFGIAFIVIILWKVAPTMVARTLIEPYSIFGRMMTHLCSPIYRGINNILAHFAEKMGSYAFYSVPQMEVHALSLAIALLSLIVITIFAVKSGRGYCNTICPIGTGLGALSQFSLFKARIDWSKCNKCSLCAKNCKAQCINIEKEKIDYTRCVTCFTCINKCPQSVIKYSLSNPIKGSIMQKSTLRVRKVIPPSTLHTPHPADASRRNFITTTILTIVGWFTHSRLNAYQYDGGLTPLEPKKAPTRTGKILPAGSTNSRLFQRRCTACHLCISACPNNVLRPSTDLSDFMQPVISFERGYCRPECTKCTSVCPTGAIQPITAEEKTTIQIGIAHWNPDLCVVLRDNVPCDRCATKCPAAAIIMTPSDPNDPTSLKIPVVDPAYCIGCGACEYLCPARPYSAIYVNGVETHRTI